MALRVIVKFLVLVRNIRIFSDYYYTDPTVDNMTVVYRK